MQGAKIPRWRVAPLGGKIGLPIGTRSGRFKVRELVVYFAYVSDDPRSERDFEFTLRIPMTKPNILRSDLYWEFVAATKMEEVGIHLAGDNWEQGIVGDRFTGRTNAYKARYVCINKKTKWCMPQSGGWGLIRTPTIEKAERREKKAIRLRK